MDATDLEALAKTEIPALSKSLSEADVKFLVQTLTEKDDNIRYNAFLLLQAHSRLYPTVYKHWNDLEQKLKSDNSYQRSLGVMLLAENVKWDQAGKFKSALPKYMQCCNDEKFITSRQAIQGLETVLKATKTYDLQIKQHLVKLSIAQYKENQQKLLNKDTAKILKLIEKR